MITDAALVARILASPDAKHWHRLFTAGEPYRDQSPSLAELELAQMLARHGANEAQAYDFLKASALVRAWSPEVRRQREAFRGVLPGDESGTDGYLFAILDTARASVAEKGVTAEAGTTDQPRVLTLAEYLKDPDAMKPPSPIIPRLVWPGYLTLLASPEGWGKSTLARAGCAAVTAGQPFLGGEAVPPGEVLWAVLEEPVATCMMSAARFSADPGRFVGWLPGGADAVRQLVAEIDRRKPAVTVVDSIQELAIKAGVDNLDDAVAVGSALQPLVDVCRRTQTGMLWLAQASKATGKYRNSSWFGHAADVSMDIAEPVEGSGERKLTVRKTRVDGLRTFRLALVGNVFEIVRGDAVAKDVPLSGEQAKVLQALQPGMTFGAWLAAYGGNRNTFKKAVTGKRGLRDRELVTQDADTGTWSLVQYTVEEALHEQAA